MNHMDYMNYQMHYQNKQFVLDTLMKLADSSPVNRERNNYEISQQELNSWIDYVNSVLNILSSYINPAELSLIKMQINSIASQNELTCAMRALNIERTLLNLAQKILQYYQ